MPRYYMHICNENGFTEDDEGLKLPNLSAAREKAVEGLKDVLAHELRKGDLDLGSFIEIEDQQRHLLMTIHLSDVVRVYGREFPDDPV
jgi:hypothetical protein